MAKLADFSDQATPVFAEFRDGGPAIARATRALGPFAEATEPALISLGTAAEQGRRPLLDAVPILRDARDLTEVAIPGSRRLTELLANLRQTGFHQHFMSLLFNTTAAINGYDQYGHFLRAWLSPNSACTALFNFEADSCLAHFNEAIQGDITDDPSPKAKTDFRSKVQLKATTSLRQLAESNPAAYRKAFENLQAQAPAQAAAGPSLGAVRSLLDTLIGRQRPGAGGGR
jgi:hypothetical protein